MVDYNANTRDMRCNVNGCITAGVKVDIDIKQISDVKYGVYVNAKFVDHIYKKSNYHPKYVSSLLMTDAENIARNNNLIPENNSTRIQFT